jgi:peptide/nickel transport system permease protein
MRYLVRRMGHALFLLAGVSILAFLFTALAPGNYFDEMRLNPQIAPETMAALRAQYGFDKPLPVRYVTWLSSVIHGEMGFSFGYNSPVAPLLLMRARNTLLLTITATLLAWAIALPLGVWSAERLGRLPDRLLSWGTAALLVIPDLALALGLLVLAVRTGWFPTGGMASVDFETLSPLNKLRDLALHMILPVTAIVLSALPLLVRHVRAAVADVLNAPFLLAAVGHGIPRRTLLYRGGESLDLPFWFQRRCIVERIAPDRSGDELARTRAAAIGGHPGSRSLRSGRRHPVLDAFPGRRKFAGRLASLLG